MKNCFLNILQSYFVIYINHFEKLKQTIVNIIILKYITHHFVNFVTKPYD